MKNEHDLESGWLHYLLIALLFAGSATLAIWAISVGIAVEHVKELTTTGGL